MKVTNYVIRCTCATWWERYILPEHRDHMKSVELKEEENGYEPAIVIGKDGEWWNDDLFFVLDRMSGGLCISGMELFNWAESIVNNPLKVGETRSIWLDGDTYIVTADDTDVSCGGRMTNECEPVE